MIKVSSRDDSMFWRRMERGRKETSKVPMCIAVPRRLPSAPNMLPLIPMAGGIRIIRPGSSSRVLVMKPSVAPASRSPREEIIRATRPRENTDLFLEKKVRVLPGITITLPR